MRKDPLAEVELHDALVHRTRIDYGLATASVELSYYPQADSPKRKRASIEFSGVESISHTANVSELAKHAFAGHVSYWEPCSKGGTTYLFLAAGVLAVTARRTAFVPRK